MLQEFLSDAKNQQEASLLITENIEDTKEQAIAEDYSVTDNPFAAIDLLADDKKTILILTKQHAKTIYDIISQFPSGGVSASDVSLNKTATHNFDIGTKTLIIATDQTTLTEVEELVPIRSKTAIALSI